MLGDPSQPETTREPGDCLPYDVVVGTLRRSANAESARIRANGQAEVAREVDAAVRNMLAALMDVAMDRGVNIE